MKQEYRDDDDDDEEEYRSDGDRGDEDEDDSGEESEGDDDELQGSSNAAQLAELFQREVRTNSFVIFLQLNI